MFEDYVGPPDKPIRFIGRHEHLREDLIIALHLSGETVNESSVDAVPPSNVSRFGDAARWTPALFDAVTLSERRAFERFGYVPERAKSVPG